MKQVLKLIVTIYFLVRPGHFNEVALSAFTILSDDSIRGIALESRNCRFPDENDLLQLSNEYSQASCFLECKLFYEQQKINQTCTPWNFPFVDNDQHTVCDPWQSVQILRIMQTGTPMNQCQDCLPDCTYTIYQSSLSAQSFRKCTEKNFGLSNFCNLDLNVQLLKPQIWADQVLKQYANANQSKLAFLSNVVSSTRNLTSSVSMQNIFTTIDRSYDAFDKDIAILSVYFDKPTLLQFGTQASQTWIQYFSNVGGLLGLCIGLSIVTIVEIIWLCMRLMEKALDVNARISKARIFIKEISKSYKQNMNEVKTFE